MFKKRVLHSTRRVKKRRQELLHKILIVFSCVLIIFFSLVYISQSEFFLIKKITVLGNTAVSSSEIENLIFKEMEGKYLGLFPHSHILLYPKKTIEQKILSSFLWVLDVRARVAGKDSIVIRIKEREPQALWCDKKEEAKEKCYFLDDRGFIFTLAPSFSSDMYIRYYGAIVGEPLGSLFLSPKFFQIISFVNLLKTRELEPLRVTIDENGDGKAVLKKGEILFDSDDDLLASFQNLDSFLRENEKKFVIHPFEYIDLRFGNKIFYK